VNGEMSRPCAVHAPRRASVSRPRPSAVPRLRTSRRAMLRRHQRMRERHHFTPHARAHRRLSRPAAMRNVLLERVAAGRGLRAAVIFHASRSPAQTSRGAVSRRVAEASMPESAAADVPPSQARGR